MTTENTKASETVIEISTAVALTAAATIPAASVTVTEGKDGTYDPFSGGQRTAGNFKTGVFAGRKAWHGLGINVSEATSVREAFKMAGMDFTVVERPAVYMKSKTEYGALAGYKDLVIEAPHIESLDGEYLSRVNSGFDYSQPNDFVELLENIVGEQNAKIETCGLLQGNYIWAQVQLPGEMRFASDDLVGKMLTIMGNWTGKLSDQIFGTAVRVQCQNLYMAAMNNGQRVFKMNHMGNMSDKRQLARAYFADVTAHFMAVEQTMQRLLTRQVTPKLLNAYNEAMFPAFTDGTVSERDREYREAVELHFERGAGNGPGAECYGTAQALHHAVTEVSQHVLAPKWESDKSMAFGLVINGAENSPIELEIRSMKILKSFLDNDRMPDPVYRKLDDDGQPVRKSRSRKSTTPRTAVQSTAVVPAAPMSDFDRLMAQAKSLGFTAA